MVLGDRVIWDPSKRCITQPRVVAWILDISIEPYPIGKRWDYHILVNDKYASRLFVLKEEIELDYQWYRDIKLKKLLR